MDDQPALYNMGSITQKQTLYQVKIGYFKCLDDYTGPLIAAYYWIFTMG